MKPFLLSIAQHSLLDWGIPEDIGATTLGGNVRVCGRFDLGTPDSPVFGDVYAATRGAYRVVYPFHEHATLFTAQSHRVHVFSRCRRRIYDEGLAGLGEGRAPS